MTCSGTLCVFDKVHTDALFSYAATLPGKTRKHENTSFRFSLKCRTTAVAELQPVGA